MLQAITPIDGRYAAKTAFLSDYFSEYALIKYRVYVEIHYFIALYQSGIPELREMNINKIDALIDLVDKFNPAEAEKIKSIEKVTNHDVKAVEYWIKDRFDEIGLSRYKEFVHFALTSQDINNTAVPLSLKHATNKELIPRYEDIITHIQALAEEWKDIPMLARTHGQPASPTLLGKEMLVYVERLQKQVAQLKKVPFSAKFGGATGNFNAHVVSYPDRDWTQFANNFVNQILGLDRSQYTTQIEHYDNLAALFDCISRINTILIDFCRDIWTYVSMDYFKQKTVKGEVGSSAMPHKVNPIDFENAEGNLGLSNAMSQHLSSKLPISRLQRDLTDSTVLRNIGLPYAYTAIALSSIVKGISKLKINESKINADLEANWMVVSEAIQNVLRRLSYDQPYEKLKELTRGKAQVGKDEIHAFIDTLEVTDEVKTHLKTITPQNYVGVKTF